MTDSTTQAHEIDVAHDVTAIIDEAPQGRIFGSDDTIIDSVELIKHPIGQHRLVIAEHVPARYSS